MPRLQRLPTELLVEIFSYIHNPKDLLAVESACKRFAHVFDDYELLYGYIERTKLTEWLILPSECTDSKKRDAFIARQIQLCGCKALIKRAISENAYCESCYTFSRDVSTVNQKNVCKGCARPHRRQILVEALNSAGLEFTNTYIVDQFVSGCKNRLRGTEYKLEDAVASVNRHRELQSLLSKRGLTVRTDIEDCHEYIRFGTLDIQSVVQTVMEMDWFTRCTTYRQDRYYEYKIERCDWGTGGSWQEVRLGVDVELGKARALRKWVKSRLEEGIHQSPRFDADTTDKHDSKPKGLRATSTAESSDDTYTASSKIPPRSLWPKIEKLLSYLT